MVDRIDELPIVVEEGGDTLTIGEGGTQMYTIQGVGKALAEAQTAYAATTEGTPDQAVAERRLKRLQLEQQLAEILGK
jgi:hypothetical protein